MRSMPMAPGKAGIRRRPILPIEPKIKRDVISIVAQGDLVVLSFVQDNKDSKGQPYKTTWFDMFRIQDGKIAEHWDSATKQ